MAIGGLRLTLCGYCRAEEGGAGATVTGQVRTDSWGRWGVMVEGVILKVESDLLSSCPPQGPVSLSFQPVQLDLKFFRA